MAETSADLATIQQTTRAASRAGLRFVHSNPCGSRVRRIVNAPLAKYGGCGILSSILCRSSACDTTAAVWKTSRWCEAVVKFGHIQILILSVYLHPPGGHHSPGMVMHHATVPSPGPGMDGPFHHLWRFQLPAHCNGGMGFHGPKPQTPMVQNTCGSKRWSQTQSQTVQSSHGPKQLVPNTPHPIVANGGPSQLVPNTRSPKSWSQSWSQTVVPDTRSHPNTHGPKHPAGPHSWSQTHGPKLWGPKHSWSQTSPVPNHGPKHAVPNFGSQTPMVPNGGPKRNGGSQTPMAPNDGPKRR